MNVQAIWPVSVAPSIILDSTKESIASNAALFDCRPVVVPDVETLVTVAVTVSVVLISITDSVPPLVSVVLVSANVSLLLSPVSTVISGAVFEPLMTIVTSCVAVSF